MVRKGQKYVAIEVKAHHIAYLVTILRTLDLDLGTYSYN